MTLFEALVVVAITALIGALAFPRMNAGIERMQFARAQAALAADLRQARAMAQRGGSGWVTPLAGGTGYAFGGRSIALPPGTRIALPEPGGLGLYADGSSTGGRVGLWNARSRAVFQVDATTGTTRPAAR